jgi:hypothetical protein
MIRGGAVEFVKSVCVCVLCLRSDAILSLGSIENLHASIHFKVLHWFGILRREGAVANASKTLKSDHLVFLEAKIATAAST